MAPDAPLRRSSRIIASAALRAAEAVGTTSTNTSAARVKVKSETRRAIRTFATSTSSRVKRARVGLTTAQAAQDLAEDFIERIEPAAPKSKGKAKAAPLEYKPEDFPARVSLPWKVGPHVSVAGGVENAIYNAASLGATAFALFVKSQRQWKAPDLKLESVAAFKQRLRDFGYDARHVLPHGNYLINLGNPDVEKREKSFDCFLDDLKRCEELGLLLYNFHPGSTIGEAGIDICLSHIAQCLNRAHKATSRIITVLENMAGSGNVLGSKFAELGKIISEVEDKSRVGVCLDTCHMFAAGYDIRTKQGWEQVMSEFDRDVGLKYLRGMHLNDSKVLLGSRKDRHENIGMGHLGLSAFAHILSDPRTQDIPLIMETPAHDEAVPRRKNMHPSEGREVWIKEIEVLHRLAANKEDVVDDTKVQEWAVEIRAVLGSKRGDLKKVKQKNVKGEKRKRNEDDDGHGSYGESEVE